MATTTNTQRVVVYQDPDAGDVLTVYTAVYTDQQAAEAILDCEARHGNLNVQAKTA